MPFSNLDLVRSIYADWERGDFSRADWADPAIEYLVPDGPDPFIATGVADMAATYREFLSTWDGLRLEAQEYREIDDERMLVYVHSSGRGKASGMEVAQFMGDGASLFVIRDGKVTRLAIYWDRDRALADLGLEE